MRELEATIEIDAPPERVWAILTDFESYPEWNSFIERIAGEPAKARRSRCASHRREAGR